MGLSQSVEDTLASKFNTIQHDLLRMNSVKYEDVVNLLEALNSIMEDVCKNEPNLISFTILNPQVQNLAIWKFLLRICCLKKNKETGVIRSKRILKLHQFIRLYDDVVYQISSLDLTQFASELFSSELTSSNADLTMPSTSTSAPLVPRECPICWDKLSDIVLPCTHGYCSACIKQWNRECPLCRVQSNVDLEGWQCVDVNDVEDANVNRSRVLIGLADKAGDPMS